MRVAAHALLLLACALATMSPAHAARTPADFSAQLDTRWEFADPALSESRFRQALAQYPADSREALEIATQIARAQGLARAFDAAHRTLDAVEAKLPKAPRRVKVRYLLERGRLFNSAGSPERAVPLFREAADTAATARGDTFYRIDALHMLGLAAPADEQLDWSHQALVVAEGATDARSRGWRASLHHNIGWAYFNAGDAPSALAHWQKALAAREAAGDAARTRVARWTVARGMRALGRLDEAYAIQHALAAEHARAGTTDGYVFEELAEIEDARGDRRAARDWAAKALAVLRDDPWFVATEPARYRRLGTLGGAT